MMPTHSNTNTGCLFCSFSDHYATALGNDIRTKHGDLAKLYFTEAPVSLLDDTEPLPYIEDQADNLDSKIIELLDNKDENETYHREGPYIQSFGDTGWLTGDVKHYQKYLQSLIEHPPH